MALLGQLRPVVRVQPPQTLGQRLARRTERQRLDEAKEPERQQAEAGERPDPERRVHETSTRCSTGSRRAQRMPT
jgi:hypothetical protein